MNPMAARAVAQSLGLRDPRVLDLVGKLAGASNVKICDFVDAEDRLFICLVVGDTEHVTIEAKGIDTALRKAALTPKK